MKACPHPQKGPRVSIEIGPSVGRPGDAREYFQQRGFARPIASNDADNLTRLNVKAHIFERPNRRMEMTIPADYALGRAPERVLESFAQRRRNGFALTESESLAKMFDPDNRFHRITLLVKTGRLLISYGRRI